MTQVPLRHRTGRTGAAARRSRATTATGRASAATTVSAAERAYDRRRRRHHKMTAQRLEQRGSSIRGALARVPFIAAVITVLALAAVAVLLLNTRIADTGVRIQDSGAQADSLQRDIDVLQREVALLDSTQTIAREAVALGLVQPDSSTIIDCRPAQCRVVPGTEPTGSATGGTAPTGAGR